MSFGLLSSSFTWQGLYSDKLTCLSPVLQEWEKDVAPTIPFGTIKSTINMVYSFMMHTTVEKLAGASHSDFTFIPFINFQFWSDNFNLTFCSPNLASN